MGQKTKNKKSPSALAGTRGRGPSPSAWEKALGEEVTFPECLGQGTQGRRFSFFLADASVQCCCQVHFFSRVRVFPECCSRGRWPSPSVFLPRVSWPFKHSGKQFFPECNSSPNATLGEDCLPRVPGFWHSGKLVTLGEFRFSCSVCGNEVFL
jgi:hypothetical protein